VEVGTANVAMFMIDAVCWILGRKWGGGAICGSIISCHFPFILMALTKHQAPSVEKIPQITKSP
jgi:hypothetical protein